MYYMMNTQAPRPESPVMDYQHCLQKVWNSQTIPHFRPPGAPTHPTVYTKPAMREQEIDPYSPPPDSKSINQILASARSHLRRLTPLEAYALLTSASPSENSPLAVLVDIRPVAQRREEGSIEGALIVERNVLEWRFDPRAESRLPMADRYDLRVVVFCSEGYTSSLAARSLQELGLQGATDIIGGYKAWRRAGLGNIGSGLPFMP